MSSFHIVYYIIYTATQLDFTLALLQRLSYTSSKALLSGAAGLPSRANAFLGMSSGAVFWRMGAPVSIQSSWALASFFLQVGFGTPAVHPSAQVVPDMQLASRYRSRTGLIPPTLPQPSPPPPTPPNMGFTGALQKYG